MAKLTSHASTDTEEVEEYPKLVISKQTGNIVLLTSEQAGTLIHLGSCPHNTDKIGNIYRGWSKTCFRDYKGTISLTFK